MTVPGAITLTSTSFSGKETTTLPFQLTPDGAVSDRSQLTLAIKISTSQDREDARKKIQTFFYDSSVIAGIVL
ncbi:hypothetical protein PILCRDRAFT_812655, partial [Piloderma croceum F 1598]